MRTAALATRALRLAAASLPVVAGFTVVGAVSRVGLVAAGCAQASSAHHAALVVEHGNGVVIRVCVSFSGAQITGEELLQRSGIEYSTQPFGGNGDAVCQVDNEPAGYTNCFQDGKFWAMFVSRSDRTWAYSLQGVSTAEFGDGDAEGFRYQSQSGSSPPGASPAGVCPAPVPATPVPRPTSASAASARPGPTAAATSHPASTAPAGSKASASPAGDAPSGSASPGGGSIPPVGAQTTVGAPPPRTPGSANAGVWIASGLGASLLLLLLAQMARSRRTRPAP
jgi:hypothetical protein